MNRRSILQGLGLAPILAFFGPQKAVSAVESPLWLHSEKLPAEPQTEKLNRHIIGYPVKPGELTYLLKEGGVDIPFFKRLKARIHSVAKSPRQMQPILQMLRSVDPMIRRVELNGQEFYDNPAAVVTRALAQVALAETVSDRGTDAFISTEDLLNALKALSTEDLICNLQGADVEARITAITEIQLSFLYVGESPPLDEDVGLVWEGTSAWEVPAKILGYP